LVLLNHCCQVELYDFRILFVFYLRFLISTKALKRMNRHSHSVLKIKHKTPQHHKTDQYGLCVILHLLILAIHFLEERVLYRQYIA